jgi:NTP pyrophosphatase (non-canonical NTP hydrolase)
MSAVTQCPDCGHDHETLNCPVCEANGEPVTACSPKDEGDEFDSGDSEERREHRVIDARALLLLIAEEVDRQDRNHPGGYPFDRNGLRLGIAALQDEVQEVYEEWRLYKRDLGNGAEAIRAELLQVMGVAFRIVREIEAVTARPSLRSSGKDHP